ncbi:MAG: tRNA preQ1(34) S-adenosylmethionine ribosyltransferase-isomerase QueA [Lachnospiraceae bacterium]|nr:tRNA preQ1(34) S-adenosylmethionine ribosyltransferase-isomerase QueA [Lachnospiraceae bacterium]
MNVSDFDYDLPEELIAQDPLERRSDSRLMVLDKKTGFIEHRSFFEIASFLLPGDCLVLNNTKVIPARLIGEREGTGAKVEILLLKRLSGDRWETIVRPGKKLLPGSSASFGDGRLKAHIEEVTDDGGRIVSFSYEGIFEEVLDSLGEMPLPPYIHHKLKDRDRYNTVYAKYDGSAAAPTAGLHFTKEILSEIRKMGVDIAEVTLSVGLGTFRPVKCERVEEHHMHSESFEISSEAADLINSAKERGGRIICVGTTSLRTIESAAERDGHISPCKGDTDIFIFPGYDFKLCDCLITNFHLPKSTLLMLVSALAGKDNIKKAYEEAVRERYRFFSFGDAMFIH